MINSETNTHHIPCAAMKPGMICMISGNLCETKCKKLLQHHQPNQIECMYLPASDRSLSQNCVSLDSAVHCPRLILHVALSIQSIHALMR